MTLDRDPVQAAREASLQLRDELLALGWPSAAELAAKSGETLEFTETQLATLRGKHELLALWSPYEAIFRYPSFQFDGAIINPRTSDLLRALHMLPGLAPDQDSGGWRRAFWLYGASVALSDVGLHVGTGTEPRAAAERFAPLPDAVIAHVLAEERRDPNTEW